jgi:hypothetical protein
VIGDRGRQVVPAMNRGELTIVHALFGALVAVGLFTATLFELRRSSLAAWANGEIEPEARLRGYGDARMGRRDRLDHDQSAAVVGVHLQGDWANAFSKNFESHVHMVALYSVWYNFVRQHKAHKLSPAMKVGITNRLWSMEDITTLVDAAAPKPGARGPYKPGFPG